MPDAPTPDERLAAPIQFAPGVGPAVAEKLARLEVYTERDLLFFFPRDYEAAARASLVSDLVHDEPAQVSGVLEEIDGRTGRGGRVVIGALLRDDAGGALRGVWYNAPYMRGRLQQGARVTFTGKPQLHGGFWQMAHPGVVAADDPDVDHDGPPASENDEESLLPVYRLSQGLSQVQVRRLTAAAWERRREDLIDALPADFRRERQLPSLAEAVYRRHFPRTLLEAEAARRRLAYQELLVFQSALALRRRDRAAAGGAIPLECTPKIDARIRARLPFRFTPGQDRVVAEICGDLARSAPMNRLLQGDVGSGKTIVALYAMLVAAACGAQAVLMAPTELLARQHFDSLSSLLASSRVRSELLVGGAPAAQRRKLLEEIASGDVQVVVGTQAVVQQDVRFARLGLAIIDEQQRFGVEQRALLRQGEQTPHALLMTATPIPRSLAMTYFGDLELSELRERPPGAAGAATYVATPVQQGKWWEFVRKKLAEGRQAYVVAPQIEGVDATGAEALYEELSHGELAAFRLGVLHGKTAVDERSAVMRRFREGDLDVLVATSLIEVGLDVPNAATMTILDAERFGLAPLHQLRGRVGRGLHRGFCCCFTTSDEAPPRLAEFAQTRDGFEVAELDLKLRGPGAVIGDRQSGAAPFVVADLERDLDLLEQTRREANEFVGSAAWNSEEFARLRMLVQRRHGRRIELGDVG